MCFSRSVTADEWDRFRGFKGLTLTLRKGDLEGQRRLFIYNIVIISEACWDFASLYKVLRKRNEEGGGVAGKRG